MSEEADLPDDPMMQTLTDALRAGPESPEWRRAVEAVRDSNGSAAGDEHRMLITARERLESGKSYREVRPGAGFTRAVMSRIDADTADRRPRKLTASFLAYLVAAALVGVVGVLIAHVLSSGNFGGSEELGKVVLERTLLSAHMDGPLPNGWRRFGELPVTVTHGMTPETVPAGMQLAGGGIVSSHGIAAEDIFAIEAAFHIQRLDSDLVPQLFVTVQPDFGPGPATSPHELVWQVEKGLSQVALPDFDGRMADASLKVSDGNDLKVRIVVGPTDAAVLVNDKQIWSGPNKLAAGQPRFAGVRFIRRGGTTKGAVTVQSVRLLEK
jgi:hypothetical protein